MHLANKPTINHLNEHLTCKLCKGYFIDATTITECLHSFCRSCIVKFLQTNKYCPVCDILVHKTKPLLNIRPDKTLQDIVYKLVPRLLQNEMQRRRTFCETNPEAKHNLEHFQEINHHIITSDESISLTLCYNGCKESARYLRCPAAVSVRHLQKLICAKYGLFDNHHVDILYNQDCLTSSLTLIDVAYIYSWKRKAPIELSYRIYEYAPKRVKLNHLENNESGKRESVQGNNNNNWKEVQLRISENGDMFIQDEVTELVNNNNYKSEIVDSKVTKKELPELKYIGKCATLSEQNSVTSCASLSSTTTKTVFSTINSTKCSVSSDSVPKELDNKNLNKDEETQKPSNDRGIKRKLDPPSTEQPSKQQKPIILNHSIGIQNLSNNHPLKKHSQSHLKNDSDKLERSEDPVFSKPNLINKNLTNATLSRPGTPKPVSKPCYMPNPVLNVPKPSTSLTSPKNDKGQPTCSTSTKSETRTISTTAPTNQVTSQAQATQSNKMIKSKASTPIGYKTLRDPPKSWNSQIANINKPIADPKYNELKNVRPAKFFKMRNNLPRYLGNPASGVKPMYPVHVSPEKDKDKLQEASAAKGEIKKHSIVKIDPKTLKPISEKAPDTTSLSNSSVELKINTSSVPIFNPLKLQNSPKGERKSPKSPHSPKTTKASPPPNKRDKLNLNFTPANPFVPNLTSPTINPNQFLYPTGPGFPPYDPRVMAAYQQLFYGKRMAFPPGLSLDLNQRKNYDLPGPTSPKVTGMPQQHSPQPSPLKVGNTEALGLSAPPRSVVGNTTVSNTSSYKQPVATKKNGKDSGNKSEKSLQNAVEKLTQNRVKEIKNSEATEAKLRTESKKEETTQSHPTTGLTSSSADKEKKLDDQTPSQKKNKEETKVAESPNNGEKPVSTAEPAKEDSTRK